MKPKAQWHFYAKGNAPLRLNQSELSAMKIWLKLWGNSMWGKVQPHSHIPTFDCVIVSFQSKLQKYRYQHCGYQQGGKLEAMKKRWATAIVHSWELYLLNMWDKVSLQSLRETPECQPDKGGPVIPVLFAADLYREQKAAVDWQPKWDINHNKLCRSSILPFLTGKNEQN